MRRKITLRHLLQMHAGLKPMGAYEEPFSDASYLALGTDMRYIVDNVGVAEEPGQRFDYNNVNFQALGFVLEAATGRRYAEFLSEKLWKPLGAGDSAVWLDRDGGSARTFGYLFATATDWAKVGLLLLHDGIWDGRRIVSPSFSVPRSRRHQLSRSTDWGSGWNAPIACAWMPKDHSWVMASSTSTAIPSSVCMWCRAAAGGRACGGECTGLG